MRRTHVRLTVRNLMIMVAVFALSLEVGLAYRRSWDYYRRQAQFYAYTGGVALFRARNVASGETHLEGYTAEEKQKVVDQARRFASHSARMKARNEWMALVPWPLVSRAPTAPRVSATGDL